MTRNEAVALIKEQLAFRTTLDSNIVSYLQLTQTNLELAPNKPWFLISEDSFTSTAASEERVSLPSDFLEEVEDATFKYRPSDWTVNNNDEVDLIKDEYDVLRRNFRATVPGPPQAYAILGNYFRIFPVPDAIYNIRLIYYKQAALLTTNIENVWLKYAPLVIMGGAGNFIAKGPIRDKVAGDVFDQWIATGNALITSQNVAREMANRSMQMGGPHQ